MTLNSEFSTGVNSPVGHSTAINPYVMDGGSETHSYNDNARLMSGPVSSATNASQWRGNMSDNHRQLKGTVMNKEQTLNMGAAFVNTTPAYQITGALDTPQPTFGVPSSGDGAAAGAGITGAAGGGVQ